MMDSTLGEHLVDNPSIVEIALGAILLGSSDVRNKVGYLTQILIARWNNLLFHRVEGATVIVMKWGGFPTPLFQCSEPPRRDWILRSDKNSKMAGWKPTPLQIEVTFEPATP